MERAEASDVKLQGDVRGYKLLVDKKKIANQIYVQAVSAAKASTAGIAALIVRRGTSPRPLCRKVGYSLKHPTVRELCRNAWPFNYLDWP